MVLPAFEHGCAETIEDAIDAIADGAMPYAGATEVIPALRLGLLHAERLVDIKRVDELRGITDTESGSLIGALTSHADIYRESSIPLLRQATREVGNPRVRSQGTIGGNLAFADPRSDLIPALLALRADVGLVSGQGRRRVPLEDLVKGPYYIDKSEDELIADVSIDSQGLSFQRYERVALAERPTAAVALVGRSDWWRLVVGAATHVPVIREGRDLGSLDPSEIAGAIEPIEDVQGGGGYKRHLVHQLVRSILAAAEDG